MGTKNRSSAGAATKAAQEKQPNDEHITKLKIKRNSKKMLNGNGRTQQETHCNSWQRGTQMLLLAYQLKKTLTEKKLIDLYYNIE